jgi:hypothetical protein
MRFTNQLPEPGRATTHDFALAYELGVEFRTVEREVNVEVNAVESTLGRVHAFEVLFEVLSGEIGGEGNDFLDAWFLLAGDTHQDCGCTYVGPLCTLGIHRRRRRIGYLRT